MQIGFFFFFANGALNKKTIYIFYSSFRFTAKLSRRYGGFHLPYFPHHLRQLPRFKWSTMNELMLTYYNHPEPIVYTRVHSWCLYGPGQVSDDRYPSLSIIQSSFTGLRVLCVPPIHRSLLLAITDFFSLSP